MEIVRLASLFFALLATCQINCVLSRSGCALFGCDEGWQCDTSYHLSGNCVEVFTDADINGDENGGEDVTEENQRRLSQILVEQLSTADHERAEDFSRADVGAPDQLRADVAWQSIAAASEAMQNGGETAETRVSLTVKATSNVASSSPSMLHASSEPGRKLSACQQLRTTEERQCQNLIGCFVTQCEDSGDFSGMQCHASTGYCWCVDALGNKLLDTESRPGQAQSHCQQSSPKAKASDAAAAVRVTVATVATEVLQSPYVLESERGASDTVDVAAAELEQVDSETDNYVHVPDDIMKAVELNAAEADDDVGDAGDMLHLASSRTSSAAGEWRETASSPSPATHHGLDAADVLLWVIVACCIAFIVSIPLLFVCLYRVMRRPSDNAKPYVFYNRNVTAAGSQIPSDRDKELLLRTARNYRHTSVSTSSEKSVVLPTQQCAEAVNGHMEIYTGHKVLEYLEEHMTNPEKLSQEWKGVSSYKAEDESTSDAQRDYNAGKNRYPDILPYDGHRVKLDSSNNASCSDYINASTICDRSPRYASYIATQAPLDRTVADFWQMVWEMGSSIIVMLTKLHDGGMSQCHRYWPQHGQQVYHMFEVQLVSEHIMSEDYCVRSFYLVNLKHTALLIPVLGTCQTKMTRTITQYQFLSWPHLAVPTEAQPLLQFRRKVKKSFSDATAPIIVHDKAGCYILIDILLNRLAESVVKEIDMAACVEHLRDQRMLMVQTEDQFRFAYTALLVELRAILDAMPK